MCSTFPAHKDLAPSVCFIDSMCANRAALEAVDMNNLDEFPIDLLLQESSLDLAQAEALKHTFSHELALIQGPPGTGSNHPQFVRYVCVQFCWVAVPSKALAISFLACRRAVDLLVCVSGLLRENVPWNTDCETTNHEQSLSAAEGTRLCDWANTLRVLYKPCFGSISGGFD